MKLMTYLCFWYAIAFALCLMHLVSDRWRSRGSVSLQEPVLVLKEGQTIVGVADRPDGIWLYVARDVADGKNL